ncbi:Iron-sulfur cluster carrier protein [termite gut metagenome]|uniref:Iron-sulfur cluster carrier protein n=1 Tax=termite gut metagenome TaxID=433724 RepID=A0A5J4RPN5_9ZZZZ
MMKTIAFYSYKGGVGRTLALSNIAMRLSEFGKKVCMLDLDLEAPGLHYKFKEYLPPEKMPPKGIVDYIHEFAIEKRLPKKINKDYYCSLFSSEYKNLSLQLIPAGNPDSKKYWSKLSAINWHELLYKDDAEGIPFFFDLKNKIERDIKPDYLLIDTRTGITEISSLTISLLADKVVVLAVNNEENISGSKRIIESLLNPENNLLKKERSVVLVLSRIPMPQSAEEKSREKMIKEQFVKRFSIFKNKKGEELFNNALIIHSDRNLELKEDFKIGYDLEFKSDGAISQEYLALFDRITEGDFSQKEQERFNRIKEANRLSYLATKEPDDRKAILKLEKALEINPNNTNILIGLATRYDTIREYEKALSYINKAMEINPFYGFKLYRVMINYKLRKFQEAYDEILPMKDSEANCLYMYCLTKAQLFPYSEEVNNDFNKLIEKYPSFSLSYNAKAHYLRKRGNYKNALLSIYKAIELKKDSPNLYATLAEIKASESDYNQFYLHFEGALKLGLDVMSIMDDSPDVYSKFTNDGKFIELLEKYDQYDAIEHLKKMQYTE